MASSNASCNSASDDDDEKVRRWLAEQERLSTAVRDDGDGHVAAAMRRSLEDGDGREWLVGGLDINPTEPEATASLAVFSVPSMRCVEELSIPVRLEEPYVAGFLGFREGPAYFELLKRAQSKPDVLLVDGNGRLHPRGAGSACHVGVGAGIPTVGVAKELHACDGLTKDLVKSHLEHLEARGSWYPLKAPDSGRIRGAVLRTTRSDPFNPVFVSVGHDVSLETAVFIALVCAPSYRIPEPIRRADHLGRGVATTDGGGGAASGVVNDDD